MPASPAPVPVLLGLGRGRVVPSFLLLPLEVKAGTLSWHLQPATPRACWDSSLVGPSSPSLLVHMCICVWRVYVCVCMCVSECVCMSICMFMQICIYAFPVCCHMLSRTKVLAPSTSMHSRLAITLHLN